MPLGISRFLVYLRMAQTKSGAIKVAAYHRGMSVKQYLKKIKKYSYCNKCKKWKLKKKFCRDNSRATGLHKNCNDCRWTNGGVRGKPFIKGNPSFMKGKHFKGQSLKNISNAVIKSNKKRKGKKKKYTKKGYEKLLQAMRKPRPHTRGELNHAWKGGKEIRKERYYSVEYRQWRKNVFERDEYICQDCGDDKGGNLEAHHIKEFSKYPELGLELSNGITLCKTCHEKRHFNPNSLRNLKRKKRGEKLKF